MRLRGLNHFAHFVALAITPRTGRHRMRHIARGPIAESIVMLADEHDHLAAEIRNRDHPLICVELRRIENRRFLTPRAPFDFIERVHAEVEEERPLQPHPRDLIRARQNLRRLRGNDGGGIALGDHLFRGERNQGGRGIVLRDRRCQRTD